MGQLGHGDLKSSGVPKRVEFFAENGLVVDYISCGGCHSAAVTRDGMQVYTYYYGRPASVICVC
jgi:alpha-tubulin suppressor-like RCC1 family protein